MKKLLMVILSCLVGSTDFAAGQAEEDPNIGKTAPELEIAGWATDKSITQAELQGRPYVLEFWATWCPPCRQSIPHLNELSQRLEPFGLRILGLSDESMAKVKPFAEEMGMAYYVGAGHEVEGLEFRGIPFAAVVNSAGKVGWAGHPLDPAFEQICWNLTRAYVPEKMKEALAQAEEGPLGPVYEALLKVEGDRAQAAREKIEANLKLRIKQTAALEGIDRYKALFDIKTLYADVPGVEIAARQAADLLEDPEIEKAVQQQQPLNDLQDELEKVQARAMQMEQEQSEQEAIDYYYGELIPLLESFIEENPDHPEISNIKQALKQVKTERQSDE